MNQTNNCFLCGVHSAGRSCSKCGRVTACSDDHMSSHRNGDRCFPYRILQNSLVGRYMVATRDVRAGEVILVEKASVIAPSPGTTGDPATVCLSCLKPVSDSRACAKCYLPICSEACEAGRWHAIECQVYRRRKRRESGGVQIDLSFVAPARVLLLKKVNPKAWKRLSYLMDHKISRLEDEESWRKDQEVVVGFLRNDCHMKEFLTEDEAQWAIGVLRTNAVNYNGGAGRALFPTFSFISHSCSCNARHVTSLKSEQIALVAQVDIKTGEEITINYTHFIHGHMPRRRKLQTYWFFDCRCLRCSDPFEFGSNLSLLRCGKCDVGFLFQKNPLDKNSEYVCTVHSYKLSADSVREVESSAKESVEAAPLQVSNLEKLLEELRQSFHPDHYLAMVVKRLLLQAYDQVTEQSEHVLIRKLDLLENSLQVLSKVDGGLTSWRGDTLKAKSIALMKLSEIKLQSGAMKKSEYVDTFKLALSLADEAAKCSKFNSSNL